MCMLQSNQRSSSKKTRLTIKSAASMPVIRANACAIDVGSKAMFCCVPSDSCAEPVAEFGAFTEDLYALASWLKECGGETVAMESTGVFWIPVFQILEDQGFDVV